MPVFQYHSDILAHFPDLRAGVILAKDLNNGPSPAPLRHVFLTGQRAVLQDIVDTPLSEIETLAAWRAAFRAFGVNPTKYRSAPEALLRRLTKKGDIPSINTLVDICNLVSIRYALPVASFDTHALQGPVTVHFADGSERFIPLGEKEVEHPERGEVIFSDPTGRVIARRWCWRQSDDSAARSATREAIFTIEAMHSGGQADVASAVDSLLSLIDQYAGGTYTSALLDSHRAAV